MELPPNQGTLETFISMEIMVSSPNFEESVKIWVLKGKEKWGKFPLLDADGDYPKKIVFLRGSKKYDDLGGMDDGGNIRLGERA